MKSGTLLSALLLTALTACGGTWSMDGCTCFNDSFLILQGNSKGDEVTDADNEVFAFSVDSGCLQNFQTGRENRNFCIASPDNRMVFGGLRIRIANIRSITGGNCFAALLDESTSRLIDVRLDASGTEVVRTTNLQPELCAA
jgi:hypothetical protein